MMVFHPIFTLDHRVLVPSGTLLTQDRVNELAEANASAPGISLPLLSFGTVTRDLTRFMMRPPYGAIFCLSGAPATMPDAIKALEKYIQMGKNAEQVEVAKQLISALKPK